MLQNKKLAAMVSVVSNTFLIILKIVCGFLSGSVSVISEALHSLCDFFASCIAFFSIQKSSKPADKDHQFGHGKFEDLAGFIEAILIIITAVFIFCVAINKVVHHSYDAMETKLGIVVMIISILINCFVSAYLFKVAKNTDSVALLVDAHHLWADVYSSAAVLLGLVVIHYTKCYFIDPILAIIVGFLILRTGIKLAKESSRNLLDEALPDNYSDKVKEIIAQDFPNVQIKSIRTSKTGTNKNIQLEILMDPDFTLKEAHDICTRLELKISALFCDIKIIIHPEPYTF